MAGPEEWTLSNYTGAGAADATAPPVLDVWAPLNHKSPMSAGAGTALGLAPTWASKWHRRRLNAYFVLWSYRRNVARHHLGSATAAQKAAHREYGDPELVVQAIRAAVLGQGYRMTIDGSADEDPPRPTDADVTEDGDTLEQLVQQWEEGRTEAEQARARQEWLDQWQRDERWRLKVQECEANAAGLGDGVYVFSWSADKRRVRARTYDPGFYFPVEDADGDTDEFPTKVHLAWEYEKTDGTKWVRRRTWELVPVVSVDPDGAEARQYAYDPEVVSRWTCVHSDGDWRIDHLGDANDPDLLADGRAVWRTNEAGQPMYRLDLRIDFIPVVHVPCTQTSDGWGESVLLRIAQILDDLAAADTDTAAAAAVTGAPVLGIGGTSAAGATTTYGPGTVFYTGQGHLEVADMSAGLDALLKLTDALWDRISVNRQLPRGVLGRASAGSAGDGGQAAESGIHLLLMFGPFRQLVEDLRLNREDKYRLVVRMVQRLAVAAGEQGGGLAGPVLDGGMEFGSFLPTDMDSVKALVLALIEAHVISKATGLRWLRDAGADIPDVSDEVAAAEAEDFEGAGLLADALGTEQAAADYLGRTAGTPGLLPPPTVPGALPDLPAPEPLPEPEPAA